MRAWALLGLIACAPTVATELDLPPEITRFGAVRTAVYGTPGTGLFPRGLGALTLPSEGDPWALFGYSDAALAAYRLPDEGVLSSAGVRVERAPGCWDLPPPSHWAPTALGDALEAPGPLSVPWATQCPARGWYDVRCGEGKLLCGRESAREGCVEVFPARDCGDELRLVGVGVDGAGCGIEAARPPDCVAEARPDGGSRWSCANGCVLDFYAPPSPPSLVVDSVAIASYTEDPLAEPGPQRRIAPSDLTFEDLAAGSVYALGVRGETVLAVTRDAPVPAIGSCISIEREVHHRQQLLDPETLAVRASRPLGDACVTKLVPDPLGDGFLAGVHRGRALSIARIDARGEWLSERPLDRALPPDAILYLAVAEILRAPGVLVVLERVSYDQLGRSYVHVLDPATLAPRQPVRVQEGAAHGADWLDESSFVLARRRAIALEVVPLEGALSPSFTMFAPFSSWRSPHVVDRRRVIACDTGVPRALVAALPSRVERPLSRVARVVGEDATPIELLPLDAKRALVSLLFQDERASASPGLAFAEITPEDVRMLPGTLRLGYSDGAPWAGTVMQLQLDGRGRAWAVAPWIGRVLRIGLP